MSLAQPQRSSRASTVLFALGLCSGLATGSAAWADDTEIFFPEIDITEEGVARPNILFIMDTSGSMDDFDEFTDTRMRRVQDALRTVLDSLSTNVNVGLGRLSSTEGGPILFPVSPIDELVRNIDTTAVSQTVTRRVSGSPNEAQQINSTVTLDPGSLTVGNIAASAIANSTEFRIDNVRNEVEHYSNTASSTNTSNSGYVMDDTAGANGSNARRSSNIQLADPGSDVDPNHLGTNNRREPSRFGLRYEGFTLPADATITTANLVFTCSASETTTLNGVLFSGEDVNNSPQFQNFASNSTNSASFRTRGKLHYIPGQHRNRRSAHYACATGGELYRCSAPRH